MNSPRFPPDAIAANMVLVDRIKEIAAEKQATLAQVALAWLLARKPWIVPIPGATKLHRLEENLGSVDVELTPDNLREIDDVLSRVAIKGERLPAAVLTLSNR